MNLKETFEKMQSSMISPQAISSGEQFSEDSSEELHRKARLNEAMTRLDEISGLQRKIILETISRMDNARLKEFSEKVNPSVIEHIAEDFKRNNDMDSRLYSMFCNGNTLDMLYALREANIEDQTDNDEEVDQVEQNDIDDTEEDAEVGPDTLAEPEQIPADDAVNGNEGGDPPPVEDTEPVTTPTEQTPVDDAANGGEGGNPPPVEDNKPATPPTEQVPADDAANGGEGGEPPAEDNGPMAAAEADQVAQEGGEIPAAQGAAANDTAPTGAVTYKMIHGDEQKIFKKLQANVNAIKKQFGGIASIDTALKNEHFTPLWMRNAASGLGTAATAAAVIGGTALVANGIKNGIDASQAAKAATAATTARQFATGEQTTTSNEQPSAKPEPEKKPITQQTIDDVWAGKYGVGADRVQNLEKAGYTKGQIDYIQGKINGSAKGQSEITGNRNVKQTQQELDDYRASNAKTNSDGSIRYKKDGSVDYGYGITQKSKNNYAQDQRLAGAAQTARDNQYNYRNVASTVDLSDADTVE